MTTNPFANIDAFGWVLLVFVFLSLAFSVVALVILITRKKPQNNGGGSVAGNLQHPYAAPFPGQQQVPPAGQQMQPTPHQPPPPQTPPQPTPFQPVYPPPQEPLLQLPEDYHDQTVSLFTDDQQPSGMAGKARQAQINAYAVSIQETSEKGTRNHDITVKGEFSIGRSASNHLQIGNSTVSAVQCIFTASQDGIYITNRSNSNVTLLNGATLAEMHPLKPGDTLQLGKVQMKITTISKHASY